MLIDPIVGWRSWDVKYERGEQKRLNLVSPTQGAIWPVDELVAKPCGSRSHELDPSSCLCGINAYVDEQHLLTGEYALKPVWGQVQMWGHVRKFEKGWRAERARPVKLWTTLGREEARMLSEQYSCPVEHVSRYEIIARAYSGPIWQKVIRPLMVLFLIAPLLRLVGAIDELRTELALGRAGSVANGHSALELVGDLTGMIVMLAFWVITIRGMRVDRKSDISMERARQIQGLKRMSSSVLLLMFLGLAAALVPSMAWQITHENIEDTKLMQQAVETNKTVYSDPDKNPYDWYQAWDTLDDKPDHCWHRSADDIDAKRGATACLVDGRVRIVPDKAKKSKK